MSHWIEQGGIIIKILIALNAVGFSFMIWKILSLYLFNKKIKNEKESFIHYFEKYKNGTLKVSEDERLNIALSHYFDPYYKGMDTIKVIASISPLLGLLGTVLGILNSFTVISQKGLDNPSLFAEGISMALVTTVGGLVVAIPHFVGHNYIEGSLIRAEKKLEKLLVC